MKGRTTDAKAERRTDEVLRIRLDGAEFWDIREYVREKESEKGSAWELAPDDPPLSDSQIRRYMQAADGLIAASCRASQKKRILYHLAQRRNLYAKALNAGDVRTALSVLSDLAKLEDLYPKTEDALAREVQALRKELEAKGVAIPCGPEVGSGTAPPGRQAGDGPSEL